ncbi:MAG: protein kinase [Candidatus Hydrogenedentes bacterium]|nr:protein kinase [Candidatus Hydrogenedentota bacterium]
MTRHNSQIPTLLDAHDERTIILDSALPARASDLWLIGAHIEGRYKIVDIRGGSGISGMGVVFILEDGGQTFAAKTFQRRFARNLSFIERFVREAETWILTGFHPNIVHAYWLDIIDAVPFLFLEFVPYDQFGRISLADWIKSGPLPLETALRFAVQVCDGMTHATVAVPGLVHRDLKPENLLIGPDEVVKITDFGLVRCRVTGELMLKRHLGEGEELPQEAGLTQAGAVFGTPSYMAPEQFSDPTGVTGAADVYAFGCCLYEMLAGRPPFIADTRTTSKRLLEFRRLHEECAARPIEEIAGCCPPQLAEAIRRCMAKRPADRWASFAALRQELSEIHEQVLGVPAAFLPLNDLAPQAVAQQVRSLNVLEGYQRAVRLRNLRDGQERSPYAFHLALASYFHCANDPAEERRQLEKAARVRGIEAGDEVTRRLAEVLINAGELREAERLIVAFLKESPGALDAVLVPYVWILVLQRDFASAEALIKKAEDDDIRTYYLRALCLREQGRREDAAHYLCELVRLLVDRVAEKLKRVEPTDRPNWDMKGDPALLAGMIRQLRPGLDVARLDDCAHTYWPDLTGYPDFSPDLAWFSQVLGELSLLPVPENTLPVSDLAALAQTLGYPNRLKMHREREEYWFWMQPNPADGPPVS